MSSVRARLSAPDYIMIDIIFCSVPFTNINYIYSAPAVLRGIAEAEGYTATTKDFICDLFGLCNQDLDKFHEVQNYFINPGLADEFRYSDIINAFYKNAVEYFRQNPSRVIGISALSYLSHKCTYELCSLIKQELPDRKIFLGGRGISVSLDRIFVKQYSLKPTEVIHRFGDMMVNLKLVDSAVHGDGEDAIIELLKGNRVGLKNNTSDNFDYPIPNFDDYQWDNYRFDSRGMELPITGSKGCVRDCDFCSVKDSFGKYKYRSSADVAKEMITLSNKYGIFSFNFTDSLVNGGQKPFIELLEFLSDHNEKNPNKRITWAGQYICRPKGHTPEKVYALLAKSGVRSLVIGAESGSDQVLTAMNKKTNVEGLFYDLENFKQHGVSCSLLTFVGHWAESYDDFVDHCRMLMKFAPYLESKTINVISLGDTAKMTSQSSVNRVPDVVVSKFNRMNVWFTNVNPTNTFKSRILRRLIVAKIAKKLKIPLSYDTLQLSPLTIAIRNQVNEINKFYQTVGAVEDARFADIYYNFDEFYNSLLAELELELPQTPVELSIDEQELEEQMERLLI